MAIDRTLVCSEFEDQMVVIENDSIGVLSSCHGNSVESLELCNLSIHPNFVDTLMYN